MPLREIIVIPEYVFLFLSLSTPLTMRMIPAILKATQIMLREVLSERMGENSMRGFVCVVI